MDKNNKIAIKSGFWYTVGDILFRTIGFLTTPIFTRMLTKSEFGQFNNILSWSTILFFIFSLDIHSSIIRSKLDYEDDLDSYTTSTLFITFIFNLIGYIIIKFNIDFFSELFSINKKYIDLLFLYLVFLEAYYIFITYERAKYKYKNYTIATGIVIVSVNVISVSLVLLLQNKLDARVYGYFIPYIIIGFIMSIIIIKRKPKIKKEYIKYALAISLPLLPHLISLNILSSSDKVMITNMIGEEENAVYSIAYLFSNILVIIYTAMNKAWAPWFLDTLKDGNKKIIKTASKYYMMFFIIIIIGAALVAPEIILILGGEKYLESTSVFAPLLVSTIFQFGYSMFLQIEVFEKKLKIVSFATMCAAVVNIGLNFLLLRKYGYIIAGYTTLIGYAVCYLIHYIKIKSMGYLDLLDSKLINYSLVASIISMPIVIFLYKNNIIRYILLMIYILIIVFLIIKNYKKVLNFWKNK